MTPRYLEPRAWLGGLIRAIVRPRPRTRLWKWLDHIVVHPGVERRPRSRTVCAPAASPSSAGSTISRSSGTSTSSRSAAPRARARRSSASASSSTGSRERFGRVVWLDPTRNSARKLVRDELDDFLLGCQPVRAHRRSPIRMRRRRGPRSRKHFRGKRMRIVGSGAEADLHGFNAELAITNELDACRASTDGRRREHRQDSKRAPSSSPTRAWSSRNSTPQKGEFGPTWTKLQSGTQHHCYVPCPHCSAARRARQSALDRL